MVLILGMAMAAETLAETRSITSMVIITIKAPDTQASAKAPEEYTELFNVALTQNLAQRLVRTEEPVGIGGQPRYTLTERI